jgi:SMP-30/gluconolaconase/LRE-like protein
MTYRPLLPALLVLAGACAEKQTEAPPAASVRVDILATIGDSSSAIEGIATHGGQLYVADWKDGTIYRVDPAAPTPVAVGRLPVAPGTWILGLVTDAEGNLYAAVPEAGIVYRVNAGRLGAGDFNPAKDATPFVTGAKGANGLAFDRAGHLWIGGGNTENVYHAPPQGGPAVVFASAYSPKSADTTMPVRDYTVNGVGFDSKGALYTLNTGTGEVTRLVVGPDYRPGAIATFVKDARLIGADGLVVDGDDNLWIDANFRNSLVRVSPAGEITVVAFSSPGGGMPDSTYRPAYTMTGPGNALRFPAELKLVGKKAYLANLNFAAGANASQPVKGASIAVVELP